MVRALGAVFDHPLASGCIGAVGIIDGVNGRDKGQLLGQQSVGTKVAAQQLLELIAVELFEMKRVVDTGLIAVAGFIGRGQHQPAFRLQHPLELGQQAVVVFEVLDGLKTHHRIHGAIVNGQRQGLALFELAVGLLIPRLGVRHRLTIHVHPHHRAGVSCHQRTPIALTRGHVQHVQALDPREHPCVAVPVLVGHLADALGREPLTGEGQCGCVSAHGEPLCAVFW